jgi:hypothetical protein
MITYDFSQGCNYEVAARPNRALKKAWAQDFTLPTQYTDIDAEEMQYIDGGSQAVKKWGITIGYSFSRAECDQLASEFAIYSGVTVAFGGIASLIALALGVPVGSAIIAGVAAVVAGSFAAYSGIFWKGSVNNGVIIYKAPFAFKVL